MQKIWVAACQVESGNDPDAVNRKERAYGVVQIRQIRLNDYFEHTGVRYQAKDMTDTAKAKEVFMYYAEMYNDPQRIARCWNGGAKGMRKKSTVKYWNKIKLLL